LQKWKRDSWTQHLFGRILKPSLGKAFETEWTFLLAVTHVSLLAQQESELGKTTQDTFGPGLQMELLQCDQNYVSLKTSKDISRWGCPTLSKTWQEWVIEQRGAYSARLNAVRHTSESACLSWPSPVASEVRQGFQDRSRGMKGSQESLTTVVIKHGHRAPGNHSTHGSRPESWATPRAACPGSRPNGNGGKVLEEEVKKSWTTPTVTDASAMSPEMRPSRIATGRTTEYLARQVQWATPKASDPQHAGPNMRDSAGNYALPAQAVRESWATPTARDHKSGRGNEAREYSELTPMVERTQSGKLNPRWVETLMGLPVGWTMPSCTSPVTIAQTSCASSETA